MNVVRVNLCYKLVVAVKVVGLNFSSATTPELLLKTLDHYCEYRKTPNGMVLSPVQVGPPDPEYYIRNCTVSSGLLYLVSVGS